MSTLALAWDPSKLRVHSLVSIGRGLEGGAGDISTSKGGSNMFSATETWE